jgi:hypothetical protein
VFQAWLEVYNTDNELMGWVSLGQGSYDECKLLVANCLTWKNKQDRVVLDRVLDKVS